MFNKHHSYHSRQTQGHILAGLVLAILFLTGCGTATPKVYHVGILSGLDWFASTADGFKAGMTELGYVEGKNIVYDLQKTNFEPDKEQQILKKFVADKVDLIFTFPTEVSLAAKAATQGTNIPVLFANASIEGVDLVKSVREPGGNITGVRYPAPEITAKRFEILHELVPQAKRIWVAYQKDYPIVPADLEALRPAAATAGVTLIEVPATSPADLKADLDARASKSDIGLDAILLIVEPLTALPESTTIIDNFAAEHRVPVADAAVGEGCTRESIFGLSTNTKAVGRLAAPLADKIFKGVPAGTIPVVSADNYLQISLKAAQAVGVTVPEGFLSQANEIIR